ncbi:hypothetical protein THPR109532_17285 [Thalassospira profundimaris]
MGHQRLGSPPASRKLPEIINLLVAGTASATELVEAITKATEAALTRALKDQAFVEALWLLVKIPQAAKAESFSEALRAVGVAAPDNPSATDLVAGYDAAIEAVQRRSDGDVTDLGEMARQAGISALYSLIEERLPSLWEPTREDVRTTLATFVGPEKFGELSQRFLTNFSERTIQYYLDREIPRHLGPGNVVQSVGDMAVFDDAVRRHCAESTMIMRPFAKDWLGKSVYSEGKDISQKKLVGFTAVALKKVRKEFEIRSKAGENV